MSTEALPPTFGRFRVVRALGRGGMGTVYLAEDTLLRRQVAVKVPLLTKKDNSQVIERFLREARAAAAISHPNVCSVLDVGEQGDGYYLVMPFLEGTPLNKLIDPDHPWQPGRVIDLMAKLALGVQAIHDKGLIHRDLKPGNVLLQRDGEPIILDLGLARSLEEGKQLTGTGQALGTPAYMSPEQLKGELEELGPATDVYALGVILYQLLTGQVPFRGPVHAVYAQILQAVPPAPSVLRPGLDPALDGLCLRAMAKEPGERPSSARAFAEGLIADSPAAGLLPPPLPANQTERAPATAAGMATASPGQGVACPRCGKRLRLPSGFTGQRARCPACKVPIALGDGSSAPVAEPPAAPVGSTETGPSRAMWLVLAGGIGLGFLVLVLGGGVLLWMMIPGLTSGVVLKGTVRLDGRPLPDAAVIFSPRDIGGTGARGTTDARGNFEINAGDKMKPGTYTAMVYPKVGQAQWDGVEVEVKAGVNEGIRLELKSR